ncbi:hypothetical protein WR25_10447 [Diploscapter pachys]|uniref:Uncharacterized protein n=1 Tax=Diploscapter pachys TaxID=2018661 RepID=A0A2A2M1D6_9BILA|nr:hypothetical protein WR25_10447 [Diploscapter pachys]
MNEQPKSDELILLVEKQDGIISALQEEIELCREQLEIITNDRSIQLKDRNDAEVVELVKEAETRILSTIQTVDFLTAENEQLKLKLEELEKGSCDDKSSMSLSKLTEKLWQLEIEVEHSRNAEKLIKQEAEVERIRNKELIEELAIARRSRSDLENRMDLRNDELQEELRKTKQTAIGIFVMLYGIGFLKFSEVDLEKMTINLRGIVEIR